MTFGSSHSFLWRPRNSNSNTVNTMQRKAFVLLSGGMDSTTCLHCAIRDFTPPEGVDAIDLYSRYHRFVEAVSIDYGQRHRAELGYALLTCGNLRIKHTTLSVGDLLSGKEILLSADSVGSMEMVHKSYDEIRGVSPSYVPFRNGLLLSAITAHAQKYVNAQIQATANDFRSWDRRAITEAAKDLVTIYYGAHAEDAANWAYPDCTPEFNGSMANAIYTGSYNTIRLATPLQWLKKADIVELGQKLGVDWASTWSCYDTGVVHCGKCPTCHARKAAFAAAGVPDPTEYAP